jgi:hypothetical protein
VIGEQRQASPLLPRLIPSLTFVLLAGSSKTAAPDYLDW